MFQGAHLIQIHCLKGAQLNQKHIIATSAWFEKEVRIVTSQMCPLKQLCAPNHGCRGWKIRGPGPSSIDLDEQKVLFP